MTIKKRIADLHKNLSTVTTRELSRCITNGLQDRLQRGRLRDGGPARSLQRTLDEWLEARPDSPEVAAWMEIPPHHRAAVANLFNRAEPVPPSGGSPEEWDLIEAYGAAHDLLMKTGKR